MISRAKYKQIRVILVPNVAYITSTMRKSLQNTGFITWGVLLSFTAFIYKVYHIYKITEELFTLNILSFVVLYAFQRRLLLSITLCLNFSVFYIKKARYSFPGDVPMCAELDGVVVKNIFWKNYVSVMGKCNLISILKLLFLPKSEMRSIATTKWYLCI